MLLVMTRIIDSGDMVSRVQCDKCKGLEDITVVAAFLKRDEKGEVILSEYERVRDHSEACFKEMHTCPTAA